MANPYWERSTDDLYKLYRKPYGSSTYTQLGKNGKVYYGDTVKIEIGALPTTMTKKNSFETFSEGAHLVVTLAETELLNTKDLAQIRGKTYEYEITSSRVPIRTCVRSQAEVQVANFNVYLKYTNEVHNYWTEAFMTVFEFTYNVAMGIIEEDHSWETFQSAGVRGDTPIQNWTETLGAQYALDFNTELKFQNVWDTQSTPKALVTSEKDASDIGNRYIGVRPAAADNGDNSIKRTQYQVKISVPKLSQVNIGGTNVDLLALAGYLGGSTFTDVLKKYKIYAPGETSTNTGTPQDDGDNIYYESGWEDLLDGGKFDLELIDIAGVSTVKTYKVGSNTFTIPYFNVTMPTLDLSTVSVTRTDITGTRQSTEELNQYIYIKDVEPSYDTQHSTLTVKARFKEYGDQTYSNEITLTKNGSKWENKSSGSVTGGQFDTDVGYDIQLEIIMDNYGWSTTFKKRSSAVTAVDEAVVFDIRGGDVSGKQTREFNMKWPVRFDGGINAILIEPAGGKYILQDHVTALKRVIPGFYYTQGVTTETIWLDQENGTSFDPDPYGVGRRDVFFFIIGAGLHAKAFLMGGSQNEIYNIDGVESGGSITWTWSIT